MDMKLVADAYLAVGERRVSISAQPIVELSRSGVGGRVLYWECFSRIVETGGESFSAAGHILAMERLGLTSGFDVYVAQLVIEHLQKTDNICLGCNISSASALDGPSWRPILSALAESRAVAERFIVEITETAPIESLSGLVEFVGVLQSYGCRVAFDDFGKGYLTVDIARQCRPDIIKTDASFLTSSDSSDEWSKRVLRQHIALSAALAEVVVVEGVETAADVSRALECGALWAQGYQFAYPEDLERIIENIDR